MTKEEYDVSFYGTLHQDSHEIHKAFANKPDSYVFKFPPNMGVIEAMKSGY